MTLLRTPASGSRARTRSTSSRNGSVPPNRRIRRSTVGEACWKDRSNYGMTPGSRSHRLEQPWAHLGRLQVADPHPVDALDRGELGQQLLEQREVAEVLAVRRRVLADEEQLAHALLPQPSRLGDDVGGSPRHERATEHRDGAERAAPVAAARDLQRRPRAGVQPRAHELLAVAVTRERDGGRGIRAVDRGQREQHPPVGRHVGCRPRATEDRGEVARHVAVGVEAEHGVGVGQLVGQGLPVTLGEAADGDDRLGAPGLLEVGGLEQGVDGVLLGLLDEAAGVDHRDVGVGGVVDEGPALGGEAAGELLGVDLVAGAPEGDQRDAAAARGGRHAATLVADEAARGQPGYGPAHALGHRRPDPRPPRRAPRRRRPQRPPLGGSGASLVRLGPARHRPPGPPDAHRPATAAGRRGGRAVLVGLRAGHPAGRRRGDRHPRAGRRRARHDRPVRRRARPGHHRRRRRAGPVARPDRLADRGRGRAQHRLLPGGAADAARPGGALPDAHPQRQRALGRLGHRRAGARRALAVRPRGGARDEPARDARRPLARLRRHHARRARRHAGAR